MLKLYTAILLGLIWALIVVNQAGGEDIVACYENATPSPKSMQIEGKSMQAMVLGMVEMAGFDPIIADKVIRCESGWNPEAIGDSGQSWGLWQIHQPAHNLGSASFDPYLSTVYAIELLKKSGWSPWTCARNLIQPVDS